MNSSHINIRKLLSIVLLGTVVSSGSVAVSSEMMPRSVLMDLAMNQFTTLCESEVFASCMGFTSESCLAIAEDAVNQCLSPLPETINLTELDNDAIESCPKTVYADAGYTEEKAGICFDKAMKAE